MTGRFQREVQTFETLLTRHSFMNAAYFRALGGLSVTVGPESEDGEGFRHIAVEADHSNGALERLFHVTHCLEDRMKETGAVRSIIFSKDPEHAVAAGRDLHVVDAIATLEIIAELKGVMPVEWFDGSVVELQAA